MELSEKEIEEIRADQKEAWRKNYWPTVRINDLLDTIKADRERIRELERSKECFVVAIKDCDRKLTAAEDEVKRLKEGVFKIVDFMINDETVTDNNAVKLFTDLLSKEEYDKLKALEYSSGELEKWYQCKCGHEMDFEEETYTKICPMCDRFGCWVEAEKDSAHD